MKKKMYVKIKKYTIVKGILLATLTTVLLMIPIFNLYLAREIVESFKDYNNNFWEDCFYNYEYLEVKYGDDK